MSSVCLLAFVQLAYFLLSPQGLWWSDPLQARCLS